MAITKKQRLSIENKIYTTFDKVDKTGTNSDYYKKLFADMSDKDFEKLMKSDFPFRFHDKPFVVEPKMQDVFDALDYLGVPYFERITQPYMYKDKEGRPVYTKECIVVYIHLKKVQQFSTHKNKITSSLNSRDMKTGLLTYDSKGGKESDRENEALFVLGLYNTSKELNTIRADAMEAKSQAYNEISEKGYLSLNDIELKQSDFLSKQYMDTLIMTGMGISNLISPSYQTKYTLEKAKEKL